MAEMTSREAFPMLVHLDQTQFARHLDELRAKGMKIAPPERYTSPEWDAYQDACCLGVVVDEIWEANPSWKLAQCMDAYDQQCGAANA